MWLSLLLFCSLADASFAPDAPRYWPKFGGNRSVALLDGEWKFGFVDGWNSGLDSMSPTFDPSTDPRASTPNKTAVPSSMDVVAGGAPGYLGPRGVGMFRTSFKLAAGADSPARLQFQACSFYCRVWVNGKEVGDHTAGGYVAFWLDVPREVLASDGVNELFVLADNRFNSTPPPPLPLCLPSTNIQTTGSTQPPPQCIPEAISGITAGSCAVWSSTRWTAPAQFCGVLT